MKKIKFIPSLLFLLVITLGCSSDDDPVVEYVTVVETVTETITQTNTVAVDPYADSTLEGNIVEDTTLDASKIWLLKGRVAVTDGVTLTIPAGTIIKAASGSGADASTLIVARGGKMIADGTSEAPIIMTSESDNIKVGGTYPASGPALGVDTRGLWGGLLILGKAPSSFKNDVVEVQIELLEVCEVADGLRDGACARTREFLCMSDSTHTHPPTY